MPWGAKAKRFRHMNASPAAIPILDNIDVVDNVDQKR